MIKKARKEEPGVNIKKWIDKCKVYLSHWKAEINKILNTAFPDTTRKYIFLASLVLIELLIMYGIACFDIGIWQNDCSVPGMIAGYWLQGRHFPFLLYLLIGGGLLVFLFFYLSKFINGNTGRGFSISESNVYGSARDINLEELQQVADILPKEEAIGTIYGQLDKTEKRLVTAKNLSNYNRNFLALAPPGYGKTFCLVLPFIAQCIRRGESCICTDTKGEVFAKTAEFARMNGYITKRIDFKNPKCSNGWHILNEIQMDDIRAKTMSQVIMENTGNEKDIHKAAEEGLLTGLCLYTVLNPDIPPEEKTLYNAFSMIQLGPSGIDKTFASIKGNPDMRVAYDYYANNFQGTDNLRMNILNGLANRLSTLSSPTIRELTSTPDVDLTLPGKRKCIYYVELHDQVNSQKFLSSLFFSFLFWDLCDFADAQDDQKLPVYVNILIEEAYACGYLPTITNAMATVRSRQMGVGLIAQGIEQMRILYGPETTETILNCCATQLCLGTNAQSTADLFEWLSGTATVKVKTEQHSVGEGPIKLGRAYSTGDGRQSLYSGNDIRKIQFERILLVPGRFDPIMLYTFGINRHPEFMKGHMPQIPGITKVPLLDKEARAFLNAYEEQRVMDFEAWVAEGNDPWADDETCEKAGRPKVIPYPELERMALAHSAALKGEANDALMKELQGREVPEPEEIYTIPLDIWESINAPTEEIDEETEENEPEATDEDAFPNTDEDIDNEEPPQNTSSTILDPPKPAITIASMGTPSQRSVQPQKNNPSTTAAEKLLGGNSFKPKVPPQKGRET